MPITRSRYQEGSIDRVKRQKGPDVWVYRWREPGPDGRRIQRKKTIGPVSRFKTESDARRAIEPLRAEINAVLESHGEMTFHELWGHFAAHELRDQFGGRSGTGRSDTTIEHYESSARAHLLPKWGDHPISDIKAVEVEKWLRGLRMGNPAKSKLKNELSCVFTHAIRHELYAGANPITTVRQSNRRARTPTILSLTEIQALLKELEPTPMVRMAVLLAAATGLRCSEMRGLKWADIDRQKMWIHIKRGVVRGHYTKGKSDASRAGIPLLPALLVSLDAWRTQCLYQGDDDWVFASELKKGRIPVWLDRLANVYVRPAAVKAGITKRIDGWHTFRRSLASVLADAGESIKTVQELLRHANSAITADLYAQAPDQSKRAAQERVSGLFLIPDKTA